MWITLITTVTPTSDNVTEAGIDYNVSTSPGKSPSYFSSYTYFTVSPTVTKVFYVATVLLAVVGFLANTYVLLAMLLSKNSRKANVNAFITHQTILDLTACVFLFIGMMPMPKEMNDSLAIFNCYFIYGFPISVTLGHASICGLVIITIERYVKIVHPIAHRNHYRHWMTRVGIIFPWIFGICTSLIPQWSTKKFVRGRCLWGAVGSTLVEKLTWYIAKFLLVYLGPLTFFFYAYWKILGVIRRQRRQVGQSQQQRTSNAATAAEEKSKRTEMNIVKTMVIVSVTFAVCFVWMRVYNILTSLKAAPQSGLLYLVFSFFSYTNRLLNPFIYATQYEVVRNWWRVILCRIVRRQEQASFGMSGAAPDTA